MTQAMAGQEPVRKGLLQSGENLIGQVSGPNAAKVTEMMEEMRNKWEELENAIATRTKGTEAHLLTDVNTLSLSLSLSQISQRCLVVLKCYW